MSAFDTPPQIGHDEIEALFDWAKIDRTKDENELAYAMTRCSVLRWAQAYGAKVVAVMVMEGFVEPGKDPVEAIYKLRCHEKPIQKPRPMHPIGHDEDLDKR